MKMIQGLSVLALLLVAACSADDGSFDSDTDEVSAEEALRSRIPAGSFKLYPEDAVVNPSCDVHTKLELNTDGTATLSEKVEGLCRLFVEPKPRTYRLRRVERAGSSCSGVSYYGAAGRGNQRRTIAIHDYRAASCPPVDAPLAVWEALPGTAQTKKLAANPPATELEGTLVVGRETGWSIQTSARIVKLVLDDAEESQFVVGKKARVRGASTTFSDPNGTTSEALDVSELLVCPDPGTINCMPSAGGEVYDARCIQENREWLEASCPGVSFVF